MLMVSVVYAVVYATQTPERVFSDDGDGDDGGDDADDGDDDDTFFIQQCAWTQTRHRPRKESPVMMVTMMVVVVIMY